MENLDVNAKINEQNIRMISDMVLKVSDNLINSEVDGLLKRPSSFKELKTLNAIIKNILYNKIRNKTGV